MVRIQFEGIATKNNDSRVSVFISEFDQAIPIQHMPAERAGILYSSFDHFISRSNKEG
jgi:hypothetical protein